jgi:hypothetical protein
MQSTTLAISKPIVQPVVQPVVQPIVKPLAISSLAISKPIVISRLGQFQPRQLPMLLSIVFARYRLQHSRSLRWLVRLHINVCLLCYLDEY